MTGPRFNRPAHPDFWLISQGLIDQDAQADAEQPYDEMIGRFVDLESLTYAANQRALRAFGPNATNKVRAAAAALWIDAFVQGIRFQNLKTQSVKEEGRDE